MQEYELERGSWLDLCEHVQSRILSRLDVTRCPQCPRGGPAAYGQRFLRFFHGPYLNPSNFLSRNK